MTIPRAAILAIGLISANPVLEVHACGDKFLVAGRGTRFQRAGLFRQPASILIYARPSSGLALTLQSLSAEAALTKVGYAPTVVIGADAFDRALRDGRWDAVVVDLADRGAVHLRPSAQAAPAVVVLAYGASRDALKDARRTCDLALRPPTRAAAFVDIIDGALIERTLRLKASPRASD